MEQQRAAYPLSRSVYKRERALLQSCMAKASPAKDSLSSLSRVMQYFGIQRAFSLFLYILTPPIRQPSFYSFMSPLPFLSVFCYVQISCQYEELAYNAKF